MSNSNRFFRHKNFCTALQHGTNNKFWWYKFVHIHCVYKYDERWQWLLHDFPSPELRTEIWPNLILCIHNLYITVIREARPFKDKARPVETFELGTLESLIMLSDHIHHSVWNHHAIVAGAALSQGVDLRFSWVQSYCNTSNHYWINLDVTLLTNFK